MMNMLHRQRRNRTTARYSNAPRGCQGRSVDRRVGRTANLGKAYDALYTTAR
jgi:hypothetical protein